MQISIEESGAIERKLKVVIAGDQIQAEVDKRLKQQAREMQLPGFRPGKAPLSLIRKRFGSRITDDVVRETIGSSLETAIDRESLKAAGVLDVQAESYEPGGDLEYTAVVELFPEISSPSLAGKTLNLPAVEISEEDVDSTLERIRRNHADMKPREGPAEIGDQLKISYRYKVDGDHDPETDVEDFSFWLGKGPLLKEIQDQLVGSTAGETREVSHVVPDDHAGPEPAGTTLEFSVTVKSVTEPILPELDDTFALQFGIQGGGIEKLRQEVRERLDQEVSARRRDIEKEKVREALHEAQQVEVPRSLVRDQLAAQMESLGAEIAEGSEEWERYADMMKRSLAISLITEAIVEQKNINPDLAEIRTKVEQMAESYESPEEYVEWMMGDNRRVDEIRNSMIEERVVDEMLSTATVVEEPVSFDRFFPETGLGRTWGA